MDVVHDADAGAAFHDERVRDALRSEPPCPALLEALPVVGGDHLVFSLSRDVLCARQMCRLRI